MKTNTDIHSALEFLCSNVHEDMPCKKRISQIVTSWSRDGDTSNWSDYWVSETFRVATKYLLWLRRGNKIVTNYDDNSDYLAIQIQGHCFKPAAGVKPIHVVAAEAEALVQKNRAEADTIKTLRAKLEDAERECAARLRYLNIYRDALLEIQRQRPCTLPAQIAEKAYDCAKIIAEAAQPKAHAVASTRNWNSED